MDRLQLATVACAVLATAYSVTLQLFRFGTHELDNAATVASEISLVWSWTFFAYTATRMERTEYTEALLGFCILGSVLICVFQYSKYVAGVKYRQKDLTGKVYIVTGSNTGIGYQTALGLVRMGATVVMACRSKDKAEEAIKKIIDTVKCPPDRIIFRKLDLCGFDSVKKFVRDFKELNLKLDGLINNAGMMSAERKQTMDGYEMVFTANHLSHFLLTNLLLPELEKSNGRVVNVTSSLHKLAKKYDFDDIMSEKNYNIWSNYAQSKLANILFTQELQERLDNKKSKVICNSVHPGCVMTEVTRDMDYWMRLGDYLATPIMVLLRKTAAQGAYCSIHCAVADSIETNNYKGLYFMHCAPTKVGVGAYDVVARKRLWEESEKITGLVQTKKHQ